jgi:hypothetical protein
MTRARRVAARCGAVLVALVVALVGPVPAAASKPSVELQLEKPTWPPWADPTTAVSVGVTVSGPEGIGKVDLAATFEFGDLAAGLDIDTDSRCRAESGTRYRCEDWVHLGDQGVVETGIGILVTAKPDRPRTSGNVHVAVQAFGDVESNRATTSVPLEVLSNRVDLSVTSNSGRSYKMVGPSARPLGAVVNYPTMTWPMPLRVTFDLSDVSHRIQVVGTNTLSGETCTGSGSRYVCVRETARGRDGVEFFGGIRIAPRSGAPPGPVGQVRISVEQPDGIDPNPGNNSYRMTLDVATGSTAVRVDVGEVTGRIGETVSLPVTMRNLGPDTVEWMGISRTPLTGGLELVGIDGCVSGVPEAGHICSGPQWMRGGTTHRVEMRVKIHRCHDDPLLMPGIHTSNGTIERGSFGTINVVGCSGTSGGGVSGGGTGTGAGSPTGDSDAEVDPDAEPTQAPASPPPATPVAAPADTSGATVHAGDWVPVGQPHLTTGLGMTGLILLLGLVLLARSARWAFVRHAGVR